MRPKCMFERRDRGGTDGLSRGRNPKVHTREERQKMGNAAAVAIAL